MPIEDNRPLARYGWPDTSSPVGQLWTARYQSPGIVPSGLAPVRITLGAPRFPLGYKLAGDVRRLSPPPETFRKPYLLPDPFRLVYRAKLDALGVANVAAKLDEVRQESGADPVLLCFEDVRAGRDWCHRLVFAEWWHDQTGETVLELLDHPPVV